MISWSLFSSLWQHLLAFIVLRFLCIFQRLMMRFVGREVSAHFTGREVSAYSGWNLEPECGFYLATQDQGAEGRGLALRGSGPWSCVARYFIHVFFVRVALTHGTLIRWFRVQFHNLWVCSISACRSEKTHRSNFVVSLWLMPAGGTCGWRKSFP